MLLNCLAEHFGAWKPNNHITSSNYRLYCVFTHIQRKTCSSFQAPSHIYKDEGNDSNDRPLLTNVTLSFSKHFSICYLIGVSQCSLQQAEPGQLMVRTDMRNVVIGEAK
jgi:hypothetical protein